MYPCPIERYLPAWIKWPLVAIGAYCLVGALVIKHGPVAVFVLAWPVVFNVIVNRLWPEKPQVPPRD